MSFSSADHGRGHVSVISRERASAADRLLREDRGDPVGSRLSFRPQAHQPQGGSLSLARVLAVIARRWYLVLAIVAVAACAALGTYRVISPPYSLKAQLLLLPSARAAAIVSGLGSAQVTNPYLALTPGLAQTGQVVAVATMDQKVAQRLAAAGFVGTYALAEEAAINAPVVDAVVTAPTPALATRDMKLLVAEFSRQLANAQTSAGAPAETLVHSTLLAQESEPHPINKSRLRAAIAVSVGLLFLGIVLIALLERRTSRRDHTGRLGPTQEEGDANPVTTHAARAPQPSSSPAP